MSPHRRGEVNLGRRTHYVLSVEIKSAENVDEQSFAGMFNCADGVYQVRVTESQNLDEFWTEKVRGGRVFPSWNQVMHIRFEEWPKEEYLFLEVLQFRRRSSDPTVSSGAVVDGRAKIPVPTQIGYVAERRDELISMTPSGKTIGGFIFLAMKLQVERFWHDLKSI